MKHALAPRNNSYESLSYNHRHGLWLNHFGTYLPCLCGRTALGDRPFVRSSHLCCRGSVSLGLAFAEALVALVTRNRLPPDQCAAANRHAFQFVSRWFYNIIGFGNSALPAPAAQLGRSVFYSTNSCLFRNASEADRFSTSGAESAQVPDELQPWRRAMKVKPARRLPSLSTSKFSKPTRQ